MVSAAVRIGFIGDGGLSCNRGFTLLPFRWTRCPILHVRIRLVWHRCCIHSVPHSVLALGCIFGLASIWLWACLGVQMGCMALVLFSIVFSLAGAARTSAMGAVSAATRVLTGGNAFSAVLRPFIHLFRV